MKYNDISMEEELSQSLKNGIAKVAGVVKRTLGPGGQPILIERNGTDPYGQPLKPIVTKDGVTVAKAIRKLKNPHENNAAQTVIGVSEKTNKIAGDGTTTATVLAEAIFNESLKFINTGKEPQILFNELKEAGEKLVEELDRLSIPVEDKQKLVEVATISANNDKEIGETIEKAFDLVGEDGVIEIREGSSKQTYVEEIPGFRIDKPIVHHSLINVESAESCVLSDCAVLVYDGDLNNLYDLDAVIKQVTENLNKEFPLFIITSSISTDVINYLGGTKQKLKFEYGYDFKIGVCKAPDATHIRSEMMEDIATLVGATVLGKGRRNLTKLVHEVDGEGNVIKSDFGFAERIVSNRFNTTIYGGAGDEEEIIDRVDMLKEQRKNAFSEFDEARINKRIGYLSNGIAMIYSGGSTDVEIKEKKDRIDDAVNATRAAIQKGIVPGGGTALLYSRDCLNELDTDGATVLFEAVKEPISMILKNVGESPQVIINKIEEHKFQSDIQYYGFDARNLKFCNMVGEGIIDPTKVVQQALTNAISIAGLLVTCGGSIIETIEKD